MTDNTRIQDFLASARIKGMDVSTVIEEEICGARYFDCGVRADLFDILINN